MRAKGTVLIVLRAKAPVLAVLRARAPVLRTFWKGKEPFLRSRGAFLRTLGTVFTQPLASSAAKGRSFIGANFSGNVFGLTGDLLARLWIVGELWLVS